MLLATVWIPIPLVLLTVNNSTGFSGNPVGATTTSTYPTEGPVNSALNNPDSILCLVSGCTIWIFGSSK